MKTPPKPDTNMIANALKMLTESGPVEVRILDASANAVRGGYVNAALPEDIAREIAEITEGSVFVTLNPVSEEAFGRAPNKLMSPVRAATTGDIIKRCHVLIDVDPIREAHTAATKPQRSNARARAEDIARFLATKAGITRRSMCMAASGNGYHLYLRVDLPVDDGGLVKALLLAFASRFDDDDGATDGCKVDCTVYPATQVVRLPGTLNTKGRFPRLCRFVTRPFTAPVPLNEKQLRHIIEVLAQGSVPLTRVLSVQIETKSTPLTVIKGGYGAAALDEEAEAVARDPGSGGANLNRAAYKLGQIVAGGHLDEGHAVSRLVAAAVTGGLSEREAMRTAKNGLAAGKANPREVEPTKESWETELTTNKDGAMKPTLHNATSYFRNHDRWRGALVFDSLRGIVLVNKPLPSEEGSGGKTPRPLSDFDVSTTTMWFERLVGCVFSVNTIGRAMETASYFSQIDPLRDYLLGVQWDGVPRIDHWLTTYLKAPTSPYVQAVGRRFLVSAVVRALQPGSKVDHVLVLEGEQGVGKSTAIRVLGGEYTADSLPDLRNKDAAIALRGVWLLELSELDSIKRSESSSYKAFLTRTEDKYRPPYGKTDIIVPRRAVFIATTNDIAYLRDETGNRRFWPVNLEGTVDVEALRRDRDQLWAEAVVAYRNNEPWWLDKPELVALAEKEQQARREVDPLEERLTEFAARRQWTTTARALNFLGILPSQRRKSVVMAVAKALRAQGFTHRVQVGDERRYQRALVITPPPPHSLKSAAQNAIDEEDRHYAWLIQQAIAAGR